MKGTLRNQAARGTNFLKSKMTPQAGPKQEDPNYGLGNITDEQREKVKAELKNIRYQVPTLIFVHSRLANEYLKSLEKFSDQQIIESSSKSLENIEYSITPGLTHLQESLKEIAEIRDSAKKQAPPPVTGGSKKVGRKTRKMRRH